MIYQVELQDNLENVLYPQTKAEITFLEQNFSVASAIGMRSDFKESDIVDDTVDSIINNFTPDKSIYSNLYNTRKFAELFKQHENDKVSHLRDNGVAPYADRLRQTPYITIGNTGKSFDGYSDVYWSLEDIGISGDELTISTHVNYTFTPKSDLPHDSLVMMTKSGKFASILSGEEFLPEFISIYDGPNTTPADGKIGDNTIRLSGITNFQNSLTDDINLIPSSPVYLIGSSTSGCFKYTGWTQSVPSTTDGLLYILLGIATSPYEVDVLPTHPTYMNAVSNNINYIYK